MNRNALLVLGLLTGCDALWHSQLGTDPGLCTQSSNLCPTGQVCDFTSGSCQPVGGENPAGWVVTPPTVSSCPQTPPAITITGPLSSQLPTVRLNDIEVDPADVTQQQSTLTVVLPRQLAPGAVQVRLSYGAASPVILNPGFEYTAPAHMVTGLQALPYTFPALVAPLAQVAAWQANKGSGLDVAVLNGTTAQLSQFLDPAVATRQAVMFEALGSTRTLANNQNQYVQSGNLAVVDDGLGQGGQDLIAAANTAGVVAFFVGNAGTPIVKSSGITGTYPVVRQLVAGGYFHDGAGAVQALSFIGWQSGMTTMPIALNTGPSLSSAGTTFTNLQTTIVSPLPLAVASGLLNNDATTDVVVLVGATVGGVNNTAYSLNGGPTPTAVQLQNLPTFATTVALANMDADPLPDAVFGLNPGPGQAGQIRIFQNLSAKVAPAITWNLADPIPVTVPLAPTAIAVVDYDGDNINDVVYAASDGIHVLINQLDAMGRPQLTGTLVYAAPTTGWNVTSLVAADFAGDSRPDFIVSDTLNSVVRLLENTCSAPTM